MSMFAYVSRRILDDYRNIALMYVGEVVQMDQAVWPYVVAPIGSAYIRISADQMEEDHEDKTIFISKR